jgi:hypothetical protein
MSDKIEVAYIAEEGNPIDSHGKLTIAYMFPPAFRLPYFKVSADQLTNFAASSGMAYVRLKYGIECYRLESFGEIYPKADRKLPNLWLMQSIAERYGISVDELSEAIKLKNNPYVMSQTAVARLMPSTHKSIILRMWLLPKLLAKV